MTIKKKQEHWAFAALRERLSEEPQTIISDPVELAEGKPKTLRSITVPNWIGGTIFLFNPELKREINDFFHGTLYPQISAVFENEPYDVPPADKIE